MSTVSVTRVDLYTIIHKGLRHPMFAAALRLAVFDADNNEERNDTAALVLTTLANLRAHGVHEDAGVMPAVQNVAPALFESLAADHHVLDAQISALEAQVAEMQAAAPADRAVIAKAIHLGYNQFVSDYQRHLGREESECNPVLQAHYTDRELAAMRGKVMASLPPPVLMENLARLFKAGNPRDAVEILSGLQANAPAPLFAAVCDRAAIELGTRWPAIRAQLNLA